MGVAGQQSQAPGESGQEKHWDGGGGVIGWLGGRVVRWMGGWGGEALAGHKGYDLATVVEILSASLSGGKFLKDLLGLAQLDQPKAAFDLMLRYLELEGDKPDEAWEATATILEAAKAKIPNEFPGGSWEHVLDPDAPLPSLVISEFLAANGTGLADEDRDNEDWIEIHNPGNEPVDLRGWSLTDDSGETSKWLFPDVVLDPGEYLVVFASAKDRRTRLPLHTNFKLGRRGETLVLTGPDGNTVDRMEVAELPPDFAHGRQPDGIGEPVVFHQPTPEETNAGPPFPGFLDAPLAMVPPGGFHPDSPSIRISAARPDARIHYTLDGAEPQMLMWGSWFERATGFLYWAVNAWDEMGWGPHTGWHKVGDGVLIYPGHHDGQLAPVGSPPEVELEGPIPSYRLKMIRAGLQDWALFSRADELGLGDYAREQVAQVYGQFGGCTYEGCAPPISGFLWTTDEEAMNEIRANIADAIIDAQ